MERLCNLTLHESQETVEIVGGGMPEIREGSDEERDGDTEKKREIEEGEEGIVSEIEKIDSEDRVENSNNDSEKKGSEKVEKSIDGDDDNVETEKKEEVINGKNDSVITEADSDNEKKISEEKKQGSTDSEENLGDREEMIDCVTNKHDEIGEKRMVRSGSSRKKEIDEETVEDEVMPRDSGCEKKEIGKKEENMDGHSEDKAEEGEEKKGGENNLKEPVKVRIPYPHRPFAKDCTTFLKTDYCPYGLVCCFNHPLRKSSKISPNGDCKDRERDGDQEKKELVGRVNLCYTQPYPQREGMEDCIFYLKTGRCSFGASCVFNHPPRNLNQVTDDINNQDVPDDKYGFREGVKNWAPATHSTFTRRRPDCVRYVKEGRCDFGAECKFFHTRSRRPYEFCFNPRGDWQEIPELETNFLGLPLRPGKEDCPEYIKHGACELSIACQYNHPNPGPVTANQGDSVSSLEKLTALVDNCIFGLPDANEAMYVPAPDPSFARIIQMLLPPQRPDFDDSSKEPHAQQSSSFSSSSSSSSSSQGSGDIYKDNIARSNGSESGCKFFEHPEKPGEPLCPAYMKYGDCKQKAECWYDHPQSQHSIDPAEPCVQSNVYNTVSSTKDTEKKMVHDPVMSKGESIYPERPGVPECMYYMKHGDCRFGSGCLFHHPKYPCNKAPTYSSFLPASGDTSGNFSDVIEHPERPGEPECAYYMSHGSCKFGWNCKFHHPKGRDEKAPTYPSFLPVSGATSGNFSDVIEHPERPGEPECAYYMSHGSCKFGWNCKFHHPKGRDAKAPTYSSFLPASGATSGNFSDEMEHPERPGEPECAYYMRHGSCKFGWNCKFHHPKGLDEKKNAQWVYKFVPTRQFQTGAGH